jgi:hypothetical protein
MNVDRSTIQNLCTDPVFDRGQNYHEDGRIQRLDRFDEIVTAVVRGSSPYDVTVEFGGNSIDTRCTCPYDGGGECKHIVAVLLAVEDREIEAESTATAAQTETVDIASLLEQTSAEELRTFLLEMFKDDRDIRERFVAFTGEEPGKTLYDYKSEIERLFSDAASRGGWVEYGAWIDFSQYHELAKTHRARGHVDAATDIYRALAEVISENMDRVDDSSGHYGHELERALESYAETLDEQELDHEDKRPYIEYLVGESVTADYEFVSDTYEEALQTLCTTGADREYWLAVLDEHVSGVSFDPHVLEKRTVSRSDCDDDEKEESAASVSRDERTEDVLYASDFTTGPLTIEDFTGGTLDVEHLAVGPLELAYFVGDAFDELKVDDPTTVEEHTVDVEASGSNETGIDSSLRRRSLLSTSIDLIEELGEEEAITALYEEIYLEHSQFCKQYAEHLVEQNEEERALSVVEDGLDTFGSKSSLRWIAADLYRDRQPEQYRETLKRLFLDHTEWEAYDELKDACEDQHWATIYEEIEQTLQDDKQRLINLYVHEGDLEQAFSKVVDSEHLSWLRRYRDPIARADPEEYFEVYSERLVPFAAGETGRRHYRTIADHLEEMQPLVSADRFEEFVDFLKDEHSNRPAFLDELEKAGF